MGEWTNFKINDGYELSMNAVKTHVTISTIYGEYTESVTKLRRKSKDAHVLRAVRKMFEAMLDYAKENGAT
jgi:hypothetical protein